MGPQTDFKQFVYAAVVGYFIAGAITWFFRAVFRNTLHWLHQRKLAKERHHVICTADGCSWRAEINGLDRYTKNYFSLPHCPHHPDADNDFIKLG